MRSESGWSPGHPIPTLRVQAEAGSLRLGSSPFTSSSHPVRSCGSLLRKRRTKSKTDSFGLRIENSGGTQGKLLAWVPFSHRHCPQNLHNSGPRVERTPQRWSRGGPPRPAWPGLGVRGAPSLLLAQRTPAPAPEKVQGVSMVPYLPEPAARTRSQATQPCSPRHPTTTAGDAAPARKRLPRPSEPDGSTCLPATGEGAHAGRALTQVWLPRQFLRSC